MDYVVNFVNKNHDARKTYEQQNEAVRMVTSKNSRRMIEQAAHEKQRKMSIIVDIILVVVLFAAIIIGFGVVYRDHFGPTNIQGQVLEDMTPAEQLEMIREVRNNG